MHASRLLHAIRLQAAWEPPRVGAPAWIRRFGRPSGVEAGQWVWLVVVGSRAAATVSLNGSALPAIVAGQPRWEHDVTSLLCDRNVLELVVEPPLESDAGGAGEARRPAPVALGAVGLEIRDGREPPPTPPDASAAHRA